MNEIMCRAELEALYPDEWILMVDPEPGIDTNYRGRVVAHSPDRAEIHRKAMEVPVPRHIAVFFTGPPVQRGMKVLGLTPRGYVSAAAPDQAGEVGPTPPETKARL
ncbi:MAG TPA: hypothetical protein VKE40_28440 [Gemmataceae bacterium]|nr:hypothetical protein [Gemmataceae bacterium]